MIFHLNKFESPPTKHDMCELGKNWPHSSKTEYFCIFSIQYYYFVIISPLEKGVALHLNKYEFPLSNDALCHVCCNKSIGAEEKEFFFNICFNISLLSPLGKGRGPSFKET